MVILLYSYNKIKSDYKYEKQQEFNIDENF
jgi:hypothetical protein